ncbi:1-(5-phosphoribosyl)-5-[(5-phosphoribosylamino)methylideneamino] imidazole-4-carboxamide isomerase [Caballeronia hypogeia]|uniref:1-(5-phosphoribosyl)-5-[(5-phosphoribosylamino)methylideneamino] imidazole-4-carboxamide isomerase n=1 Tax=Caballeronia hypogeia TaxID=1777140 RepID=A0A158BHK0_9BURK|nr:HisA/HisF-related TIM barrel protein [Caballeronia hypogeia]SAK69503.1 1-(5-phosphoribosyl)-5-[(5-phosphoribosylamino)methylideneamino] imidazole-4-carboxamide isomerase [Caballeronia hypogeia]
MQVIPVLDLLDGHAVRAVRGERSRYRPIQSSLCATSDPVSIARALVAATGSRTLYVADLGAILLRGAHDHALAALCDTLGDGFDIWLDAGFTAFAPMRALVERITRLSRSAAPAAIVPVFGTETLLDIGAIAEASACGFEPILSLDYRGGGALGAGHIESAWWPSRVIVMTLDHVGAYAGPDLETLTAVRAIAGARKVIGAGGVRNDADLALAADGGAGAWLVASAIHDGTVGRRDVDRGAGSALASPSSDG